jgi:hypothetical protein
MYSSLVATGHGRPFPSWVVLRKTAARDRLGLPAAGSGGEAEKTARSPTHARPGVNVPLGFHSIVRWRCENEALEARWKTVPRMACGVRA